MKIFMANQIVLIDSSARVARFLPKISRNTIVIKNGVIAVTTLA